VSDVEKVMIWKEYEAYLVQVKQIGTSACGPTAVLNVLVCFHIGIWLTEHLFNFHHNRLKISCMSWHSI